MTDKNSNELTKPPENGDCVWDQYINEPSEPENEPAGEEALAVPAGEPPAESPETTPGKNFEDMLMPEEEGLLDSNSLKIDEIKAAIGKLQKEFREKIKNDEQKNKIIDSLHHELQDYKDDIFKKHLHSTIMDIIQFIDNIKKLVKYHETQDTCEKNPQKILKLLQSIPSDLEDICSRQGVFSYACDDKLFDPARQRILKRIDTEDEDKDKSVAERIRPGYEWDAKIIRPEMVSVYHYQAPIAEAGEESDE